MAMLFGLLTDLKSVDYNLLQKALESLNSPPFCEATKIEDFAVLQK